MLTNGLEAFDTTLQKTHTWLKEIMQELGWSNRHWAYAALRGVLHSLRDRLPAAEAVQLGAQLPMLIRGLYYEGWKPSGKPLRERDSEQFLVDVLSAFGETALVDIATSPAKNAEAVVRAVLGVLSRHTTECASIRRLLPASLRSMWPALD
jgi:uncharacterized protein (DUF2267 family)